MRGGLRDAGRLRTWGSARGANSAVLRAGCADTVFIDEHAATGTVRFVATAAMTIYSVPFGAADARHADVRTRHARAHHEPE